MCTKMKYMAIALFLMMAVNLSAQSNGQLWNSANDAYSMGQYETAYNDYLKIEESGHHSYKLYYNMGNACYKMGNAGKAILYYEKALKLDPAGEDAKVNLQIAKLQTLDKIETVWMGVHFNSIVCCGYPPSDHVQVCPYNRTAQGIFCCGMCGNVVCCICSFVCGIT